jgi:hypothetical protein
MQQVIPALDTAGSDQGIDGLANGNTQRMQDSKVSRRLKRDFLAA